VVPVFNEFDTRQPNAANEPITSMPLYLVEAGSFDLLLDKRYNLCNGYFLLHIKMWSAFEAMHNLSIIKKGKYIQLV
ncbi:MAG: hypothetical protein ACKPKO_59670, partial [Candidatus Fonsibacter sp.]